MKFSKKAWISLILTVVLLLTSALPVFAAGKVKTTITFKGKTATMATFKNQAALTDMNGWNANTAATYKSIKKALGKATIQKREGSNHVRYTYKKGKSSASFITSTGFKYAMVEINIKDKNFAINGVKVGMTKNSALKKLRKVFGTKAVCYSSLQKAILVSQCGLMPIRFNVKNGKISSIEWMHS